MPPRHLREADLQRRQHIDAVLAPAEASLELADELARLEPLGLGNPGVTLLAPAASLDDVQRMGDGRRLGTSVALGGFRCRAVWFGHGASADELRAGGRLDVAYRLARNEWNGAASVQMFVRAVGSVPEGAPATSSTPPRSRRTAWPPVASVVDMRGRGVQIATIARLIAAGERVLVLVADPQRRKGMLGGPLEPSRLGSGTVALADYDQTALITEPERRFGAVVALDPPADHAGGELLAELGRACASTSSGERPRSNCPAGARGTGAASARARGGVAGVAGGSPADPARSRHGCTLPHGACGGRAGSRRAQRRGAHRPDRIAHLQGGARASLRLIAVP